MEFIIALLIVILGMFGLNFFIWGSVGLVRYLREGTSYRQKNDVPQAITRDEVAILTPAHNEELVIAQTIEGALKLLPPQNIHIITSEFERKDRTAEIARTYGVNVLELPRPLGKAHKLETAIKHFDFPHRFKAVLFVDADTIISPDYLDYALPYFNDPTVCAVAGHASTLWEPQKNSFTNNFFLSYRERFYFFIQLIFKFGQSWKYVNVMPIVPGFASIYRSSVLPHIDITAPGLVIEDFNMTFEVHHKKLGKIIYSPKVIGYTQDPDNLKDYFKQVRRWNLGFWQTVFRHGYWTSSFWVALALNIFETIFSSVIFFIFPITVILLFMTYGFNMPYLFEVLIKGVFVGDYILTIVAAYVEKRPVYLLYGLGFLFLRFIDSIAYLSSIPKAVFAKSTGAWTSPTRR
jgi:cellulose synthase/poly-beta-1,6-N-acetylglucosamine synthase-like glycosyltransferase